MCCHLDYIVRSRGIERYGRRSRVSEESYIVSGRLVRATWSRGVAPKTRGSAIVCYPTTPLGCRTGCLTPRLVRHPGGVENLSRLPLPRSSALRASTRGLKNDDPYGAPPLRDRQAEHQKRDQSMEKHGDRGYHFLAVKLKCVTPAESLLPYLWRNTNTDIRRV